MKKAIKIIFGFVGILLIMTVGLLIFSPDKPKNDANYRTMSSRALTSYYQTLSQKAGVGVPDIDESAVYFEEYDTEKGLKVTKNTFTLAGNDKIQHKYTMTWRQKTGELIQLIVDGKVVFNDDKMRIEATKDNK